MSSRRFGAGTFRSVLSLCGVSVGYEELKARRRRRRRRRGRVGIGA